MWRTIAGSLSFAHVMFHGNNHFNCIELKLNWQQLCKILIQHDTSWSHWGWDKMAAILQMAFSNSFSCMEIVISWFQFDWSVMRDKEDIFYYKTIIALSETVLFIASMWAYMLIKCSRCVPRVDVDNAYSALWSWFCQPLVSYNLIYSA